MPVFETEALVLKSFDLAEADRIVVFFTRDHGIVRGVAKGAKRLKSRFGSTLEPFSTVNLRYFQKDERELVSIDQVELSRSCFAAASDPAFLHTFSYLADLLMALVPPHDPNETLYRMTKACLDSALKSQDQLAAVRLYFELWLLRLCGYLPDWNRCEEGGHPLALRQPVLLRSDFHLVCHACVKTRGLAEIPIGHVEVFRDVQKVAPSDFLVMTNSTPEIVIELSAIFRRMITRVVGRELLNERTLAVTP